MTDSQSVVQLTSEEALIEVGNVENESVESENESIESENESVENESVESENESDVESENESDVESENESDVESVEDDFLMKHFSCSICNQLLYKPVTLLCQHNFCWPCIKKMPECQRRCPICRTKIFLPPDKMFNYQLDQFLRESYPDETYLADRQRDDLKLDLEQEVREELRRELYASLLESTPQTSSIPLLTQPSLNLSELSLPLYQPPSLYRRFSDLIQRENHIIGAVSLFFIISILGYSTYSLYHIKK